ncbi:DUF5123 domain-containing protein [Algoriphagus aestuariicola]|uniref:DUF5123 domain-containing protein n=1 Tax=Algoriphagus aestuariicola TaxID=1852016 RepID=A0ABS3BVF2_9BACT|nr:DUF4957 domain-containing protein [Algoriphagus aestuariicola]MBN7803062.1 DUF5123 domain-containing protein [Algoriphagus aestuariicola]
MNLSKINISRLLLLAVFGILGFTACKEDEMVYEQTRLFRPVLNEELFSEANTIIVNMGNLRQAVSYTLEVSRDTFKTVDYLIETDTAYVVVDKNLVGEDLFWNTLYQVRATARAADAQYDSKASDLGNVRTQRFPSIINDPSTYDVIDIAARVTWVKAGAAVTSTKVFAGDDLKLTTPLMPEQPVEGDLAETVVTGLEPDTQYQIAIYSDDVLRGWAAYTTLPADIDPNAPGVIDVRENTSLSAVADAVATAPDGATILVKKGMTYDLPSEALDKSITIRAAYGFGADKAKLYTTGNWNIAAGAQIDHIRFVDLELRGADYTGDYVFNPNASGIRVGELLFDNCEIGTFRGILRIRGTVEIDQYIIRNSMVDSIGGYGLLTTDTDPKPSDPTARVNNILFENSTFNKIQGGITSRNNSNSVTIESCTFANFPATGGLLLRYRGGEGNNNVTQGVKIYNSVFGHGWDEAGADIYSIRGIEGLETTVFDVINVFSTADFSFASGPIPGFPIGNYSKGQNDLWVNPNANDFNFKDGGFSGKYTTGDPRWRVKL